MQNCELSNSLGIPSLTRAQMGPEIAERIRCARQWCQRHWPLLCNPDLTSRSKFELYKAFVRPILTYACELWHLTACESKKLLRCEAAILLEIYKSKYPQRHPKRLKPSLRSVYKHFHGTDIVAHVNCERLRWKDLLKHEERALRRQRDRTPRCVHWWDKPSVSCTRSRHSSQPYTITRTTTSKNKEENVEQPQSPSNEMDDNDVPG